ncbi:hypothetical protein E2C01_084064 [Portunus trituberculatus]|uniref:Uncharacterized protein n=1 Tax=Portunus trituberculatus TaxID=210409 RepID=A0A5B7IUA9_PORTR|nr:hypothetical protein [Portunus trituberculatus]
MDPPSTLMDPTYTHLILIWRPGLEVYVFGGSLEECYCVLGPCGRRRGVARRNHLRHASGHAPTLFPSQVLHIFSSAEGKDAVLRRTCLEWPAEHVAAPGECLAAAWGAVMVMVLVMVSVLGNISPTVPQEVRGTPTDTHLAAITLGFGRGWLVLSLAVSSEHKYPSLPHKTPHVSLGNDKYPIGSESPRRQAVVAVDKGPF